VSLLPLYARGRRKVAVALFFLSMLATAAALVMWGVGGALYGQLAELLGPGRYVVFGGSFTDADLLAAVQAVCSLGGYGVVYRPVKVRYVNGSAAIFTAAFVPRGLMRGVEVLDAVALRHVAAAGDVVDVEVGGRWYQVRIAEVRDFSVFVPGLAADLYLDAEFLGLARYDVLVVEKGNCGGARELEALFPCAQVFDTTADRGLVSAVGLPGGHCAGVGLQHSHGRLAHLYRRGADPSRLVQGVRRAEAPRPKEEKPRRPNGGPLLDPLYRWGSRCLPGLPLSGGGSGSKREAVHSGLGGLGHSRVSPLPGAHSEEALLPDPPRGHPGRVAPLAELSPRRRELTAASVLTCLCKWFRTHRRWVPCCLL